MINSASCHTSCVPSSFKYCLMPREKGFIHMLREMGPNTAVYDIALAYPSLRNHNHRPNPLDMISGNWEPSSMHLRRWGPEELPKSDEGLKKWCACSRRGYAWLVSRAGLLLVLHVGGGLNRLRDRFVEKEELLRRFYEDAPPEGKPEGSFPGEEVAYRPAHWLMYLAVFAFWTYGTVFQFVWIYRHPMLLLWWLAVCIGHGVHCYKLSKNDPHARGKKF